MTIPTGDPTTLTLHAVRLLGFAVPARIASRFGLDPAVVEEVLEDARASGWVTHADVAGSQGWSLTDRGRGENERLLREELDALDARATVVEVHRRFLPVNARFLEAVTRWQLRPSVGVTPAAHDQADFRSEDRVIASLTSLGRRLASLEGDLAPAVTRFSGYGERYDAAAARVGRGELRWVDGVGVDSCHVVWMPFHEDLLATLGIARGQER